MVDRKVCLCPGGVSRAILKNLENSQKAVSQISQKNLNGNFPAKIFQKRNFIIIPARIVYA